VRGGHSASLAQPSRPILSVVTTTHEEDAAASVEAEIKRLRNLAFSDLLALEGQSEHRSIETADGKTLGLEVQIFWDDREHENLRVMVDAWDPSRLLSRSIARGGFIKAPDESFVGE
jgi:hypothetical protein